MWLSESLSQTKNVKVVKIIHKAGLIQYHWCEILVTTEPALAADVWMSLIAPVVSSVHATSYRHHALRRTSVIPWFPFQCCDLSLWMSVDSCERTLQQRNIMFHIMEQHRFPGNQNHPHIYVLCPQCPASIPSGNNQTQLMSSNQYNATFSTSLPASTPFLALTLQAHVWACKVSHTPISDFTL